MSGVLSWGAFRVPSERDRISITTFFTRAGKNPTDFSWMEGLAATA